MPFGSLSKPGSFQKNKYGDDAFTPAFGSLIQRCTFLGGLKTSSVHVTIEELEKRCDSEDDVTLSSELGLPIESDTLNLMKTSLRLLPTLLSGLLVGAFLVGAASAQGAPASNAPKEAKAPLSTEDKVKAEFAAWRYAGAKISASFQRGPVSLLSITTADDLEKVWKYYMTLVPTENKVPLVYSWEIPGDNTMIGANYNSGSSYAVSLNSAPREAGTIIYQKGTSNFVIEIRARTPEQIKETGIHTDIKLIKMRPLTDTKPDKTTISPAQPASNPATTW